MFTAIDPQDSTGPARELLAQVGQQLGRVPNLYRAMSNSPAALAAYLAFRQALQHGELDVRMRERIALLTAQLNACEYCVAAHAFRAHKLGLSTDDIQQ